MDFVNPQVQPVNPVLNTLVRDCLNTTLDSIVIDNCIVFRYEADATKVPSTGKAIHAMWQETVYNHSKRFVVYCGDNDAVNLYFSPEVNMKYRCVHDIDHALAYEIGKGTTRHEDELYLNCMMAYRVYRFGMLSAKYTSAQALHAFFAMYHDTVGQAVYYRKHGTFCVNQRQNTVDLLADCVGTKAVLAGREAVASQVMLGYMKECGL